MSISEAVKFTGLGRTKLYDWMNDGLLPWTQVGRKRLVPRRALIDLLARELRSSGAPKAAL